MNEEGRDEEQRGNSAEILDEVFGEGCCVFDFFYLNL